MTSFMSKRYNEHIKQIDRQDQSERLQIPEITGIIAFLLELKKMRS